MGISKDFEIPLSNGNYTDAKVVHKFGYNPAVGTAIEDVWFTSGNYTWLQSAVTLEAISTEAADTAAGAGAQQVTVQGLDANWDEVSATIEMNGASASAATTQTFIRVHRAYVSRVGTYMSTSITDCQQGTITIRTSGSGATHITLGTISGTRHGQSLVARYTIPRNHTGFIHSLNVTTLSTKPVEIYLYRRTNGNIVSGNMTCKRLIEMFRNVTAPINWQPNTPIKIDQMTDVWLSASVATTTAEVEANFELIQVRTDVVNSW